MRALVFAAGLGERMRPLTDTTPKPLLEAGGRPLVAWHLERLAAAGVRDVVLNTSWLADCFPEVLGDGARWGLRLHFLYEGATPLETGGGMLHALPLLGEEPFIAVNGDVWTDVDLGGLPRSPAGDAHLVMVDNPAHNPGGDFVVDAHGQVHSGGGPRLTFAGVGVYRPALLDRWRDAVGTGDGIDATPPRFRLAPVLRAAMARGRVTGQHHRGRWTDVGTPARLAELDQALAAADGPIDTPWDGSDARARALQVALAARVQVRDGFRSPLRTVAGLSARETPRGVEAVAVLLDATSLALVATRRASRPAQGEASAPASFRWLAAMRAALDALPEPPDLVFVDGHGRADPSPLGIASHVGLAGGLPTIGVADTPSAGTSPRTHDTRGAYTALRDERGRQLGWSLRSHADAPTLVVSPGHRVALASVADLVMRFTRTHRLPEPIRIARGET